MAPDQRPVFDSYALPLPRRRAGPAAALSFVAHLSIAMLVLWRGAALFESGTGPGSGPPGGGGGGGGGRSAVSWFALPALPVSEALDIPQPPAAVSVPTVAVAVPEPLRITIDLPVADLAVAPPATAGAGAGTSGGPGRGPGQGGGIGTGTGTGTGADSGSGSGGGAGYILPASPKWTIIPPDGMPRGRYEVRFWVTADGVVSRVEVTPPLKDSDYRREFTKRMMGYLFNPATTRDGHRVDYVATVIFTK